jgi:hypothetical protein
LACAAVWRIRAKKAVQQAMIQGIAFMSHQLGSFVGAFGGGILCDKLGSL